MKKQILAFALVGAFLIQPFSSMVPVYAEDNKAEEKQTEEQNGEEKKKDKGFGKDIEKKRVELLNLDKEMSELKKDIKELNEGLKKESYLLEKEQDLKVKEKNLEERWEQFAGRLQTWQIEGKPEDLFLEYLLGSESIADLVTKAFTYNTLLQADQSQIQSMRDETTLLMKEMKELEEELTELKRKKAETVKKEKLLVKKQKNMKKELSTLERKEVERLKEEIRLQEERKRILLEKQLAHEKQLELDKRKKELLDNEITEEAMEELKVLTKEMNIELSFESTFIRPAEGRLSSKFGIRPNPFGTGGSEWHSGIDIANPIGTPILSTANGVVVKALSSNSGYGNYVTIQHDIDGETYYSVYAHLSVIGVGVGEKVRQGEIIALMGSTGRSTGPHLHFEIQNKDKKAFDPEPFLDRKDKVNEKPITEEIKKAEAKKKKKEQELKAKAKAEKAKAEKANAEKAKAEKAKAEKAKAEKAQEAKADEAKVKAQEVKAKEPQVEEDAEKDVIDNEKI